MVVRHKTKKRRGWYHEGKLKISKSEKEIEYRSGWEKEVSLMFDLDTEVVKVEYECLRIPYITNIKTRKIKIYLPDFLITYKSGSKKIIEIKRDDRVQTKIVKTKAIAAEKYIKENMSNTTYEIWTKKAIDDYKKLLGYKSPPKPKKKSRQDDYVDKSKKSKKRKKTNTRVKVVDPTSEKLFATFNKCKTVRTKIKK